MHQLRFHFVFAQPCPGPVRPVPGAPAFSAFQLKVAACSRGAIRVGASEVLLPRFLTTQFAMGAHTQVLDPPHIAAADSHCGGRFEDCTRCANGGSFPECYINISGTGHVPYVTLDEARKRRVVRAKTERGTQNAEEARPEF